MKCASLSVDRHFKFEDACTRCLWNAPLQKTADYSYNSKLSGGRIGSGGWMWVEGGLDPTHANDVSEVVTYQGVYWIYREVVGGGSVIGLEHVFTSRDNSMHKCAYRNACCSFFPLIFFFINFLPEICFCAESTWGHLFSPCLLCT